MLENSKKQKNKTFLRNLHTINILLTRDETDSFDVM